jgi:hypothetical protein
MNAKKLLFRTSLSTLGLAGAALALSIGGAPSIHAPILESEASVRAAADTAAPVSTQTEPQLAPRVGNCKSACYGDECQAR